MKTFSLLAALFLMIINIHSVQGDTVATYNITQTYSDKTTFSGTFTFDSTTQTITSLSGILYDNAMAAPALSLTYQLPSSSSLSDGNGGIIASVYLYNTTTVFASGSTTMTAGNNNASVTIDVNAANPLSGPTSLTQLAYADCSSGGIMGKMCTTGNYKGGTMKGVPTSEIIVQASPTPASSDACLFNWAESNNPAMFAPAGAATLTSGAYTYRYYSGTNDYLGVSSTNNHVYYMVANGQMQDEGTLYSWLPKANCPVPTQTNCLFNWAETNYPGMFAPAGAVTLTSGFYTYRYYTGTNAYLGVSSADNNVYYMGANGQMLNEGQASNWYAQAGCM